ncbi:MAG: 4Fe-4S binding protein [Candidatus Lokiarchaeota archaeon]|nr:4Fe-4S binding protein [Candidatus Lokiarchaeota archaeon]
MSEEGERSEEKADEADSEETKPKKKESAPEKEKKKDKKRKVKGRIPYPLSLLVNIRMLRRLVQIFFIFAINAYIFTAWFGLEQVTIFWEQFRNLLPTLPIIAPLEAPFAMIAGSFDTMQREFTAGIFPFFTLGAMIIILAIVGRAACGWVCPIGTFQDFASLLTREKIRPAPNTEEELRRVKGYLFIIVMFLAVWMFVSVLQNSAENLINTLGLFAYAAFDPINPAYIIFKLAPEQAWPTSIETLWLISTWGIFLAQIGFVALVVIVSIWFPRWFCRWLCPAGWLYGVIARDSLIGIGRNPAKCTPKECNTCEVVCPMNIRIRRFPYQHVHSPDCIMCLECLSHCPNGAIEIKFG